MEMDPNTARGFWKALMDNATGLIADAHALLERGSFGRARSLTILAQEELGKALWIYEGFEQSWTTGCEEVQNVPRLTADGRHHAVKYMEAFVFGQELAAFWGNYEAIELPTDESQDGWDALLARKKSDAEVAGRNANQEKMAGFYVDLDRAVHAIRSPAQILAGTINADLHTAAQVIEMLLIKDHSRMKLQAQTIYDSTHEQQQRLLPISHPEEWRETSEEFRRSYGYKCAED
jgi:AbiV family abortive infection protein